MMAEVAAPVVEEKSRSPATIAAIALGGDIITNCGSICSAAKNPLSLPKWYGMIDKLFDGTWIVTLVGADADWTECDTSRIAIRTRTVRNGWLIYMMPSIPTCHS